jgi:hypothetical protein
MFATMLTACGSEQTPETTAAVTVPTTVAATEAVPAQPLELTSWVMTANTWSSPNGATIHISAATNYHEEGQKADFVVRLEGDEIISVPCQWDGTSYTASADLNAANGYCYYVILTAADGTVTEVAVNTPAAPTNEAFIDMEAALESYCSVIVEESSVADDQLTLVKANVQVKTPVITNDGEAITCQEAALVLSFNGEELSKEVLTLPLDEETGIFEAFLENIVFDIPELKTEQKVELYLHVLLSNGQELSAFGGNWVYNADGLLPAVG